jgi:hypothetical protein
MQRELQEQLLQQVQEQPREPVQVQELLLFGHKQREQQQRSRRSEREIYSFVIPGKKIPEFALWISTKPSQHSEYCVNSGLNYSEELMVFTLD